MTGVSMQTHLKLVAMLSVTLSVTSCVQSSVSTTPKGTTQATIDSRRNYYNDHERIRYWDALGSNELAVSSLGTQIDLTNVNYRASRAYPGQEFLIENVPTDRGKVRVELLSIEGGHLAWCLFRKTSETTIAVVAPFLPTDTLLGSAHIAVWVRGIKGPEAKLEIEESGQDVAHASEDVLSTLKEITDLSKDTPASSSFATSIIDSSENPNSLSAILNGSAPRWSGIPLRKTLLNQFYSNTGIREKLAKFKTAMQSGLAEISAVSYRTQAVHSPIDQLNEEMQIQSIADRIITEDGLSVDNSCAQAQAALAAILPTMTTPELLAAVGPYTSYHYSLLEKSALYPSTPGKLTVVPNVKSDYEWSTPIIVNDAAVRPTAMGVPASIAEFFGPLANSDGMTEKLAEALVEVLPDYEDRMDAMARANKITLVEGRFAPSFDQITIPKNAGYLRPGPYWSPEGELSVSCDKSNYQVANGQITFGLYSAPTVKFSTKCFPGKNVSTSIDFEPKPIMIYSGYLGTINPNITVTISKSSAIVRISGRMPDNSSTYPVAYASSSSGGAAGISSDDYAKEGNEITRAMTVSLPCRLEYGLLPMWPLGGYWNGVTSGWIDME